VATFEALAARGRQAADDPAAAVGYLRAALRLWRGRPLEDLPSVLDAEVGRLEELRLAVHEDCASAELAAGAETSRLVAELRPLVATHPLRERLRALLMTALYRVGLRDQAIAVYQEGRGLLAAELGLAPGDELQRSYQLIIAGEPDKFIEPPASPEPGDYGSAVRRVPAQLPHDVAGFVSRDAELARLHALVPATTVSATGQAVVISAIEGLAGVGKTALAVHFAHQVADQFPDGQLFINLRGFDASQSPLPAPEAIGRLMRGLGVDPRHIPPDPDERAAQYRSVLAGLRVLIMLDNASSADQVRPLLPGQPGCLVLITSRRRLSGLVGDGAHRITLDVLEPRDAVVLLRSTVGAARLPRTEAARIARLCGYLPLALRLVAERLLAGAHLTAADLADQLTAEQTRLRALASDDDATAVRAAFWCSYRALPAATARTFRLLGLHAGPEISCQAAAALAGSTVARTRRHLEALASLHFLQQSGPDRYRFHDLLRLYAVERVHAEIQPRDRKRAIRRVLSWYLHSADAAERILVPHRHRVLLREQEPHAGHRRFVTPGEAVAWCETERANLVAAVRQAAQARQHTTAWELATAMWGFFYLRKHWGDWIDTHLVALAAARRGDDLEGEAWTLGSLGFARWETQSYDLAMSCFQRALAICQQRGDLWGQGIAYTGLGLTELAGGRAREALDDHARALAIFREKGDRWAEGINLTSLGTTHRVLGNLQLAVQYHDDALAVRRGIGDEHGEAITLHELGDTYEQLDLPDKAIECFTLAIEIQRRISDRYQEARTLSSLGTIQRRIGRPDEARESWQRALSILDGLGAPQAPWILAKLASLDDVADRSR
jgi:tetratricopeptide (TPR) repeat protein